ncbi:MAG: PIF1 family ATP-dependent DNA helicase [Opitutaceae bacterium]|nr:PIF1 family ATP-dependent DNA helicase [Opitutaceae bacterium]
MILGAPVLALEQLNDEQRLAVDMVKRGENIMITGPAGTGKSVILRYLESILPEFHITAFTGIAALNVGGCTIHSWAGLGKGDDPASVIAERHLKNRNYKWYCICRAKALAIDETSMLDADGFDLLDQVLRMVRQTDRPFGGLQLILFGDFLQLAPVAKDKPLRFAFESRAWAEAKIKVVYLKRVMRQNNQEFAEILNQARTNSLTEASKAVLRTRINAVDPDPSILPVRLVTHNADADLINVQEMLKLPEPERTWTASDWAENRFAEAAIDRDCIAPRQVSLRVGAQVMLLRNLSVDSGLVNGSIGVVTDLGSPETGPVVDFGNGVAQEIETAKWETKRFGEVVASRSQIPLRAAYAISIHKSQGMTLDKIEVSLRRCFADGQAYVALSRARTLEGLFIKDISGRSIQANPRALEFYRKHAVN